MINRQYQGRVNNAQGRLFEDRILAACEYYRRMEWADMHKTPEPFRCLHKNERGKFTGQFIAKAQPDFCGTLNNGQSIVFEAKFTRNDRINKNVLTDKQSETLGLADKMKAKAFVCLGIQNRVFLLPYCIWADMKMIYGRQYLKPDDIAYFEISQDLNCILFLHYINYRQQQIEFPKFVLKWISCKGE